MTNQTSALKPAIKIGPKDWREKLVQSKAQYCEVWYRVDQPEKYSDMLAYLSQHNIKAGLHFWGMLDHNMFPNIAYPDQHILTSTIKQIEQCIDVAAQHQCHYVNIHSGNRIMLTIDFTNQTLLPAPAYKKISLAKAAKVQTDTISQLHRYAASREVLLLTESIPQQVFPGWNNLDNRLHPIPQYPVDLKLLFSMIQKHNFNFTNDISHTFCDQYDQPLTVLWRALVQNTKRFAPYTKLIHLNTLIPPYNGTDSHHGITPNDFSIAGIFPTRIKLIQLLKMFRQRDDVWIVNEPHHDHVDNFFALQRLLTEI